MFLSSDVHILVSKILFNIQIPADDLAHICTKILSLPWIQTTIFLASTHWVSVKSIFVKIFMLLVSNFD